jgi:hypothetical protein
MEGVSLSCDGSSSAALNSIDAELSDERPELFEKLLAQQ